MRIAVLADIHGNLRALDAVLSDIEQHRPDMVLNLGDLLSGALEPGPTAARLSGLGALTVRGNHERHVLTDPDDRISELDRRARDDIDDTQRDWLASLPLTVEPAPGVLAFHATPVDDTTYLLETVGPWGSRCATPAEVAARLGVHRHRELLVCGHTHLPRRMMLDTGALVINPGSVGWPAYRDEEPWPHAHESGSPHARYALIESAPTGWSATFRSIPYDWDGAASVAERHRRPDIAHALRTGHVTGDRPHPGTARS